MTMYKKLCDTALLMILAVNLDYNYRVVNENFSIMFHKGPVTDKMYNEKCYAAQVLVYKS